MRRLACLILVILVCFLSGCDFFLWRGYYDREHKFILKLPRNWEIVEGEEGTNVAIFINAPSEPGAKFRTNINVSVVELPKEIPLDDYYDVNKEEMLSVFPGSYDMLEGQVINGFVRGQWMAFSTKIENVPLRIASTVWIKYKRAYVITRISPLDKFSKYEKIFNKVVSSFRMK